jgi:hypothetical protein
MKYQATDEQIKQVANLSFTGMAIASIARSVGTTEAIVKSNIMADPRFKDEYNAVCARAAERARDVYTDNLVELMGLAVTRLREELRPGSRNGMIAVQTVFKTAGLMKDNSDTPADSKLTVILPGTSEPQTITVVP